MNTTKYARDSLLLADVWVDKLKNERERMTQSEENHYRLLVIQYASISIAASLITIGEKISNAK